jgi:hypothetical protein
MPSDAKQNAATRKIEELRIFRIEEKDNRNYTKKNEIVIEGRRKLKRRRKYCKRTTRIK